MKKYKHTHFFTLFRQSPFKPFPIIISCDMIIQSMGTMYSHYQVYFLETHGTMNKSLIIEGTK